MPAPLTLFSSKIAFPSTVFGKIAKPQPPNHRSIFRATKHMMINAFYAYILLFTVFTQRALRASRHACRIKDAGRSMALAADEHDADVVGMDDQNSGKPNAGNLYIKHNARTIKMMEAWLAADEKTRGELPDQEYFVTLDRSAWARCSKEDECRHAKANGQAAIWLHPW